jgi:hypothetical protein
MADNYGAPPVHGPEHERLAAFIGKWHAEGRSYGQNQDRKNPHAASEPWLSDEVTEWHPGRFFVIQREDARTGSEALITHAVIGYDPEIGGYVAHAFENHGHHNRYEGRVDGRTWTFDGARERVRIVFSEDGRTQTVTWEWRPHDDEWLPLCDRTNIRVD